MPYGARNTVRTPVQIILYISLLWPPVRQSLGSEETQALVRAMESRVERVQLQAKVTLDISSLMGYGGQGKCGRVECSSDTTARYKDQLRTWTKSRNWAVTWDGLPFTISRILSFT